MVEAKQLDAAARRYADGLFAKAHSDLRTEAAFEILQLELASKGLESVYNPLVFERTGKYIENLGKAKADSLSAAYDLAKLKINDATVGTIIHEVVAAQETALAGRLSSMRAEAELIYTRTGARQIAEPIRSALEAELRREVTRSATRIRQAVQIIADRNAVEQTLATQATKQSQPWHHVGEYIVITVCLSFAFAFVKLPVLDALPSWLVFFGFTSVAGCVLEVIKRPSPVQGRRRFVAKGLLVFGLMLFITAAVASAPWTVTQDAPYKTLPMPRIPDGTLDANKSKETTTTPSKTAPNSQTAKRLNSHPEGPQPRKAAPAEKAPAKAEQSTQDSSQDMPQPLRADMERFQIPTLRELIRQMNADEMWLSNVFERLHDGIPIGPLVDYPKALQALAQRGEIQILKTVPHKFRTYSGELLETDFKFKVVKLADRVSPTLEKE